MKNSYRNFYVYGLVVLSLLSNAGCNLANSKAESKTANSNTVQVEVQNSNADSTAKEKTFGNAEPPTAAASIAGNYKYYTVKDSEGYDNSLSVEDKGNGKLHVSLSGSYLYKVDDTESMHEAEGEGDAQLRGNVAVANIKDEEDKNCRVTLTFTPNQATVKIPDVCHFNIALDGVYKKNSPKSSVEKQTNNSPKTGEVSFDKLNDFVNDFDAHRPGDRFVIVDIAGDRIGKDSRADEQGNTSYKGLFYLEINDASGDSPTTVLTSGALIKSLHTNLEYEPATLRLTAVLVESTGKFDVYRLPFVTKIEGLNDDGSVMWTATGAEPAKVKFIH